MSRIPKKGLDTLQLARKTGFGPAVVNWSEPPIVAAVLENPGLWVQFLDESTNVLEAKTIHAQLSRAVRTKQLEWAASVDRKISWFWPRTPFFFNVGSVLHVCVVSPVRSRLGYLTSTEQSTMMHDDVVVLRHVLRQAAARIEDLES